VLLLHRVLPAAAVIAGMRAALAVGVVNPELVAVEARRAAATADLGIEQACQVVALPERPAAPTVPTTALPTLPALPADARPLPTVTPYDQLLRRRERTNTDPDNPTSTGEAVS
jgi:hypothetical protein